MPSPKSATTAKDVLINTDLTHQTMLTCFGCGSYLDFERDEDLAFAFLADFFEELDLNLLDLKEPVVLFPQQVIDFFV